MKRFVQILENVGLITIPLFLATVIFSNAQTLATFDFNSSTDPATQNVTGSTTNFTVTPITYGTGVSTKTVLTTGVGTLTVSDFENTTIGPGTPNAFSTNDYIEFTITPNSGYELHVNAIVAMNVKRNVNGPQTMILYDNRSGSFAASSNATVTPLLSTTVATKTLSLLTPLVTTNPVSFRIYGYNRFTATSPQQLIFDKISITGIVAIAAPTVQSSISITNITQTSMDITITNGNGAGQLVLLQEGFPVDGTPAIFTYYSADPLFGNGDYITGNTYSNFAVYNDMLPSPTFTVTGLNPGTEYHAAIFDYNWEGSPYTENYLTANPGITSASTLAPIYTWNGGSSADWTNPNSWTPSRTSVTIFDELRFDAGGTITVTNVPDEDIGKLIISNSTYVRLQASTSILLNLVDGTGADLVVSSGSTLELGNSNPIVLYASTNTQTDINGTLFLNHASSQIEGDGTLNINGTFSFVNSFGFAKASTTAIEPTVTIVTGSSSIISYSGAGQAITRYKYPNLILTGSGNKTADSTVAVTSNLTLAGSAVLVPLANDSVYVGGNWTSYGAAGFSETGITTVFNGTGAQALNTTGGEQFYNMVLRKSAGTLTLSSGLTVAHILTLTQGTLASGGNLTVNLNTGGVDGSGTGSVIGNVNLFKNISAPNNRTHYFATPLSGQTVTSAIADDAVIHNPANGGSRLFYYDLPTKKFIVINDMNTVLTPGKAYSLYFATGNLTLDYTGTYAHTAGYTNPMGTTVGTYIIGNPYPSTIDWDAASGWTKTNMNNAIYFWNASTNKYDSYINGAATGSASRYIAPFQAYMVSSNNASAAIASTNAVRTPSIPRNILRLSSDILKIKLDNGTDFDETLIRFDSDATSSFDGAFDAFKFYNSPGVPSLYTTSSDAKKLAINTSPLDADTIAIPLSLENAGETVQTMTFSGGTDIDGYELKLLDKVTGQKTAIISGGGYSFNRTETEPADRFTIFVERVGITTGTSTFTSKGVNYYTYDKTLYISSTKSLNIDQIELYDTFGNKVKTLAVDNSSSYQFNLQELAGGIYILRAVADDQIFTGKVVLK